MFFIYVGSKKVQVTDKQRIQILRRFWKNIVEDIPVSDQDNDDLKQILES